MHMSWILILSILYSRM